MDAKRRQLAERTALVLTEDLPTRPLRRWVERVAAVGGAAVWCVDTACLVPLGASPRRPERAYSFRSALAERRDAALHTPYPTLDLPVPEAPQDLPFASLCLQDADLSALIGTCAIDHAVPPVADTEGGLVAAEALSARGREFGWGMRFRTVRRIRKRVQNPD